ncbi:MAG: hypothetical protein ACRDJF_12415 [Actinomycetota bacterium]
MLRRTLSVAGLTMVAAAMLLAGASPASAHERRSVGGQWNFVVGWGDEPAYSGFKNSVQLILSGTDDQPVTDLGDTLEVEVIFGGEKRTLRMEPAFRVGSFGRPGDYRAYITPTRPGNYTFRFFGTIKDTKINESFTSGETTFNGITDTGEIQFPAKDPSNAQLAGRLDRQFGRLDDKLGSVRAFALVGLALAVVALVRPGIRGRGTRRRA